MTQDLVVFKNRGVDEVGRVHGSFEATGLKPRFMERVGLYGLEDALWQALAPARGA